MVFAWPSAQIGMMDAKLAAKIMYADADIATVNEKAAEYAMLQSSAMSAAKRGYVDTIIEAVACEEKVQIVGFGTFEVRARSERQGRDPRTNSPITIPASKVPAFKAGKAFKDAMVK